MSNSTIKAERGAAIILEVFSLAFAAGSLKLKIGQMSNPGSGFMPLVVGISLIFCSTVYLLKVFRCPHEPSREGEKSGDSLGKHFVPMAIAGCSLVYPLLLAYLDFLIATFLLVWLILIILKYKKALVSFCIALVMTVATFLLFAKGLGVVLPSGDLEQRILGF